MAEFKLSYTASQIDERLKRIDNLAEKSELPKKTSDLVNDSDFATQNYVKNSLGNYALKSEIPVVDLSDYALKNEIPTNYLTEIPAEYVTESELNAKGYLTEHQSLAGYALKTEIPTDYLKSIPAEYVTEEELVAKGYLTEHQSLADYALKSEIPTDYLTEIPEEYVTETELNGKGYLTEHQDLSGYALKTEIPSIDGLASETYVEEKVAALVNSAPETLNTLDELAAALGDDANFAATVTTELGKKANTSDLGALATKDTVTKTDLDSSIKSSLDKADSALQSYTESDPTVPAWAKAATKPTYTADEVGALPADTVIPTVPTNVSAFNNDAGYLTEHQSLAGLASEKFVSDKIAEAKLAGEDIDLSDYALKSDIPTDYLKSVPEEYVTEEELNAKGYLTEHQSLAGLASETYVNTKIGEINIPDALSDLTTDSTHRVVTDAEKADWNAKSNFSGDYNDLSNKPTIPSISGLATETYVNTKISEIPTPDVSGQINTHNTATDSHNDIRLLVEGLTTRLNTLANSDDTTLDQMSEIVAYIKSNKSLIEGVTNSKVNVADIVDNLTTNVSNKPLSAAQGVALKALIDAIVVPTKVSELTNDSGFLSSIPNEYVTETELNAKGYLTSYTETDPTVPSWAKQSTKPSYTKSEVGLGNVDNTSDTDKPVSTVQATAIADAKKAGTDAQSNLTTHTNNKSNPHGVTKAQVGLGNVDNVKQYSAENPPIVAQATAPTDTSVVWVDIDDNSDNRFQEAVNIALAQAKASGEFDGKDGDKGDVGLYVGEEQPNDDSVVVWIDTDGDVDTYYPVCGVDYWTDDDKEKITTEVFQDVIAEVQSNAIQQTPLFANSIEECTDTSKVYVLPDGYIYGYIRQDGYTNLLKTAIDTDSSLYNGVGYKNNYHLKPADVPSEEAYSGMFLTGFIPVKKTDVIRVSSTMWNSSPYYARIFFYNADFKIMGGYTQNGYVMSYNGYTIGTNSTSNSLQSKEQQSVTVNGDETILNIKFSPNCVDLAYMRLDGCGSGANAIITLNEEISGNVESGYGWCSTGHAFVPADYEDRIIALENKTADSVLKGKTIAVLGDSISSVAYTVPNYWQMIAEKTGCNFLDYGVSGSCIANGSTSTAQSFVQRAPNMDTSADAVLVMGGTNDYGKGILLGAWDSTDNTTLYGALNELISLLRTKYNGKPIVFCTPIKNKEELDNGFPKTMADLKASVASTDLEPWHCVLAIKAKCAVHGIPVIDLYNASGIGSGQAVYFRTDDKWHPSSLGECRIANMVQPILEQQFLYGV